MTRFSCQEASGDLKKIVQEPVPEEREKSKDSRMKTDEATASTADTDADTGKMKQGCTMKQLRDEDASSNDDKASGQEADEDENASEDSSNDDDLFRGCFAIADKNDKMEEVPELPRVENLPASLQPSIANFEPEVLQSLPPDVPENLGCRVDWGLPKKNHGLSSRSACKSGPIMPGLSPS